MRVLKSGIKSSKFWKNSNCMGGAPQSLRGQFFAQSLSLRGAGFSPGSGSVLWVGVLCFPGSHAAPRSAGLLRDRQVSAARLSQKGLLDTREVLFGEARECGQSCRQSLAQPRCRDSSGRAQAPRRWSWGGALRGMTKMTQEGNGTEMGWGVCSTSYSSPCSNVMCAAYGRIIFSL